MAQVIERQLSATVSEGVKYTPLSVVKASAVVPSVGWSATGASVLKVSTLRKAGNVEVDEVAISTQGLDIGPLMCEGSPSTDDNLDTRFDEVGPCSSLKSMLIAVIAVVKGSPSPSSFSSSLLYSKAYPSLQCTLVQHVLTYELAHAFVKKICDSEHYLRLNSNSVQCNSCHLSRERSGAIFHLLLNHSV